MQDGIEARKNTIMKRKVPRSKGEEGLRWEETLQRVKAYGKQDLDLLNRGVRVWC